MPQAWVNEFVDAALNNKPVPPANPGLDLANVPDVPAFVPDVPAFPEKEVWGFAPGQVINVQAGKAWDKALIDDFVQKHVKKPMKLNPNLDNGFKVHAPVVEPEKKKVNAPQFDPVTANPDRIPNEIIDAVLLLLDENKEVPLLLKRTFVFMHYHNFGKFVDFDKALESAYKLRKKKEDIDTKTGKMAKLYKDEDFELLVEPPEEL